MTVSFYMVYLYFEEVILHFSEVRGIVNVKCVRDGYQTVQAALLDYTLTCYSSIQVNMIISLKPFPLNVTIIEFDFF